MLFSYLPSSVSSILFTLAPCFTAPSFENFAALVAGWVLCLGPHTVSRAILAAWRLGAPRKHHSTLYRFLSAARWSRDEVGHGLFEMLLPFLPATIYACVDDTLAHRTGPHLFGAGMHHDSAGSTYGGAKGRRASFAFGHNWVVLAVHVPYPWNPVRGIAVPVLLRLYRSKRLCPTAQYRKRTEMAAEMLDMLRSWLPEGRRLELAGDSEYACRTLLCERADKLVFTGPLPWDAALFALLTTPHRRGRGRPRLKGCRLPSLQARSKRSAKHWQRVTVTIYGREVELLVQTWTCLWFTVTRGHEVRVVLTRDPSGRYKDKAYFCTDADRSPEEILVAYCRRWALEVTFAEAKGHLGLEEPRNGWWRRPHGSKAPRTRPGPQPKGRRGSKAVLRTVPFIFTVYGLVVVWYLRHGKPDQDVARARRRRPWDVSKSDPSYADMLAALRRELWAWRFLRHPVLRRHRRKIEPLLECAAGAA